MHAFVNYSHWSLGLIFSFSLACGSISHTTQSLRNRIGHRDQMTSTCQQLRQKYQIKCKIIHFEPSKCSISPLKKMVQKLKAFIIAG